MTTVTLNMLWPYQRMIGMPRVAAIEHPFGRPYGDVGDVETQTEVLRAALEIASRLGCSLATVKRKVAKIREVWQTTRDQWED